MKSTVTFDESVWTILESLLPDDVTVRGVVLEDFLWFMKRSKKYKSNSEKVEGYIRHLKLKANPKYLTITNKSGVFRSLNLKEIEEYLQRTI